MDILIYIDDGRLEEVIVYTVVVWTVNLKSEN